MDLASEQRWINFQLRLPQHGSQNPISRMGRLSGLAPTRAACFLGVNSTWKKKNACEAPTLRLKGASRSRTGALRQWLRAKPSFPLWCGRAAFLLHSSCHLMGSLSQLWNLPLLQEQILLAIICWKLLGRNQRLWESLLQSTERDLTTG